MTTVQVLEPSPVAPAMLIGTCDRWRHSDEAVLKRLAAEGVRLSLAP